MALDALLFDVDGTLLDTNDLHVTAWRHALASRGYRIGTDRIEVEIGKGGDKLVPAVLGLQAEAADGEALRVAHSEEFVRLAKEKGVAVFPRALDLLDDARRRGLKVVLATSSKERHLDALKSAARTDLTRHCDAVVAADDAQESKPAPDIVAAAVRKLGLSPAQCAIVGDTLYDMQAAKLAGVIGLAVRTGYQSTQTLMRSGARAVFADVAELYARLPEALRLASQAAIRLTQEALERLMREAIAEAEHGLASGEPPVGAVIADGDGRIIARGFNRLNGTQDRTAHAEMVAFRDAAGRLPRDKSDCLLVSTLEPCVVCTGAAMLAAIDTIVYGLRAPADGGSGRVEPPQSPESQMPRIVGDVLAKESRDLFLRFLSTVQDPLQRAFAQQLLASTAATEARDRAPGS
jgi:membrane protein